MEEQSNNQEIKKESNLGIQDYMSIGYLFLLILGVANQAIFYGLIGVNIFEYTSILDVLLSPLAVISSHWVMPITIIVMIPLMIGYFKLFRWYYTKLSRKEKYQKGKKKEKLDKILKNFNKKHAAIPFLLMMLIFMFLGFGIGGGQKTNERIKNNDFKLTHQLTYEDGEQLDIKMLGKNSLYVFYVTKGDKEVSIAPIDSNIKVIKKLKKEKVD